MSRSRPRRKPLVFHKMHALGNDFMVIDGVTQSVHLEPAQIARWGNRHTGVGFDQLLVIEPPTVNDADFYFRIYNSDGSSAEQCGNGTRAVALLVKHLQLSKKPTLHWQSAAGLIQTTYTNPQQIETTMTVPVLELDNVPFSATCATASEASSRQFSLTAGDDSFDLTPVSMGNPHGVIFVDNLIDTDVEDIGSRLTRHAAFPAGANIGFCQVVDRQFLRLRVFERGAGETQACGSGACAAVVAARLHDKVDTKVKVSLPGGKLRISWPAPECPVTMSGAATLVYKGELQV
jgi:diaminopimelate epimerase